MIRRDEETENFSDLGTMSTDVQSEEDIAKKSKVLCNEHTILNKESNSKEKQVIRFVHIGENVGDNISSVSIQGNNNKESIEKNAIEKNNNNTSERLSPLEEFNNLHRLVDGVRASIRVKESDIV